RKRSGQTCRSARALQALDRAAAGNERRIDAEAEPTPCRPARSLAHYWYGIREQNFCEMPVKNTRGRRPIVHLALLIAVMAVLLFSAGEDDASCARATRSDTPGAPAPAAPVAGVLGWIFPKQAEFYRQFSGLIRSAKADGSAVWSLAGLSFLYGIFH